MSFDTNQQQPDFRMELESRIMDALEGNLSSEDVIALELELKDYPSLFKEYTELKSSSPEILSLPEELFNPPELDLAKATSVYEKAHQIQYWENIVPEMKLVATRVIVPIVSIAAGLLLYMSGLDQTASDSNEMLNTFDYTASLEQSSSETAQYAALEEWEELEQILDTETNGNEDE